MRDVWRSTQKICASTAERLCSSHTDSRATGACIHFNTADQQAAVVWSRFAGIIRRLGFFFYFLFSCDNIGILELREASLKEYFRKRKRGNHRCEKAGAFRDLHLFFSLLSFAIRFSREMQPLPDRCVAPQLQPTGLYRRNQSARFSA